MKVFILEIGELYCTADTLRLFDTREKAFTEVPQGFMPKEVLIDKPIIFYSENNKRGKREWCTIKEYGKETSNGKNVFNSLR